MSVVPMNANVGGLEIDYEAVLKALNLNPRDPKVQALVLTCQQYGLDPVLKHMVLINGDAYVTHRGLLHVAHASGRLDGIELVDQGDSDDEWWAKVSVFRNDMSRPFTYVGRYAKAGSNKKYGPEMAIARAETMALRRAFDVAAPVQEEQDWPAATGREDPVFDGRGVREAEDGSVSGPANQGADPSPPATAERRGEIKRRAEALSDEFKEIARAAWKLHIAVSPDDLTDDDAAAGERLLDDIEAQQVDTFAKRKRKAFAELRKIGLDGKDAEEARHAFVEEATAGQTKSCGALSEAQLAAVVDAVKGQLEHGGNEAA